MKKLNNGYADHYYLTKEGIVYNASTENYIKPDKQHKFKLKTTDNKYKTISLKSLYRLVYNKPYCVDLIESLPDEVWKLIRDTNGLYYVSSYGRIKSYTGYNAILLKPYANQGGYLRVDIVIDGQRQTKLVHRLVAASFLPMPKDLDDQLHHINGLKESNEASNLIWLSPAKHRLAHQQLKENKENNTNVCTESEENTN